ncbi:20S proteasome subunit [Moesziomyces antarcticus]|uniref:Proteasome subunit beta n=2 Tax=Pseudozyma antarctica TaxID=84753 RepID=A0A081CEB2_PSEA2|nr:20S proteasome subunit [Moesziomyces antarcticus]GAK65008.1 20S proteasome subunit [Moesziomyces antarcticus]SPO46002.1 probable PRE3 - 20S proteasome subunit (beta1) [Moesziomyces antarcticus]
MAVNGMDITGHLKKGEVDLGTSIMAVAYDKGVILGADSRTTMGSYIANRVTDKLTHLSDRIYCCRSGSAADTQAIADIVTYYLDMYAVQSGNPVETKVAANLFQEIVYQNKDRLSAGIIVAGWDKQNGGSVFNIPLGGGVFQQPWAIGGSGSTYIYGYCDATWKAGWGKEKTLEFVKNALALAMRRDGSSGGTIRLVDITEDGVERHFVPGDQLPELADKIV